jgi:hypothetical protein
MSRFSLLQLKSDFLVEHGLPNCPLPVPVDGFAEVLASGGDIDFGQMLHWLQVYCAEDDVDWKAYEPAAEALTRLLAPPEDMSDAANLHGDTWYLEVGPVDLAETIVTIQRNDDLLVAISPREDFTLRAAVFNHLDARSLSTLIRLSALPHSEHGSVNMRSNNWEYALDASHGMGNFYAYDRGDSYMSYWEFGLGILADRSEDGRYMPQRHKTPLPANLVATQIGVFYECSEEQNL